MKIGASYWMFEGGFEHKRPVVEAMQEAQRLGFDAIELCIASQGVLTDKTTEDECEKIVAESKKIGIEISSVATLENWYKSPTANDPKVVKQIIDFTKKALQVTKWLGTDAYLYIPGAVDVFFLPDSEVIPYDVCYKRAKQAMAKLLPTAEKVGVALGIENVGNKFLLSPLETRDFIDSFQSKRVGAYFDIGNILYGFGYPEHWIKILGKRIKRLHVKDFKKSVGTLEGFVDLLEGDVNFAAVKKCLATIGYNGYVTAEMIPYAPGRPEKAAEAMKKIFK